MNFAVGTKSSKHYSRETFQIRREVLEKGYYSHILNEVVQLIKSFSSIDTILDIGCGEGYYSKQIKEVSGDKEIIAFDISKDAVQLAAKSDFSNSIKWFVGNLEEMPIKDKRIDCILDIFTPANYSEFNRVLKEGGYVIKVIPGNAHLKELRETAKEQLKSKDVKELMREELAQKFNSALESGDAEQVAQAFADMADNIQQEVLERAKDAAAVEQMDAAALAARGLRQITSEERSIMKP